METNQQLSQQIEIVPLQEQGESYQLKENLSDNEIEIFEKKYKKYLNLQQYTKDGKHTISANNYAGILVLPNHIIKIKPKIPNASFFGMLKYALQLPEILSEQFPITEKTDFWEILIVIFALLFAFYLVITFGAGKSKKDRQSPKIKSYLFGVRILIIIIAIVSLVFWFFL